jgi:mRNA-degrading endonuclease RelE of RelBE toxin-antitoxin system
VYEIVYAGGVEDDLRRLSARNRARVLDKMEEQLQHEPTKETRRKKLLVGLKPPWEHENPTRELRVGEYRVFYDVDEGQQRVMIRLIVRKPPHKTTEEIL